jgi:hypothetical protein
MPVFDFFESIAILVIMIYYREIITPDFIHFITCIVDEEAHFICVTIYWMVWKCFLMPEDANISQAAKVEQRFKTVARALIELIVSLILTYATYQSVFPMIYCLSVFILVSVRSIYFEKIDLTFTIFLVLYFSQNFIVNSIDFVVYKQMLGFYHDEMFVNMFSYKLF